jgi:acid phosphatase family membrane protein YuiD
MFNEILIIPLISILVAQSMKFFIKSNRQKFSFKRIASYSGMPSGHSSLVSSLVVIVALKEGVNSPLFAISFFLAIIIIRDALGIRRYLGEHGRTLNILVKDLKDDNVLEKKYPHLLEQIGHTPWQVVVGCLIGSVISIVGYYIF